MVRRLFLLLLLICSSSLSAQTPADTAVRSSVVHVNLGQSVMSADGKLRMTLIDKKQHFNKWQQETWDVDIHSPKSVSIHPDGRKYYVNSLEGGRTVAYEYPSGRKLAVMNHRFGAQHRNLWNPASGLYCFRNYLDRDTLSFMGKPVESAFSHGGRYLWVPYYRRSFDINAQEPSAVAVIDTQSDSIIRLMETGPLPKMIKVSPDNRWVVIPHWGDNTVSLIDIQGSDPAAWHHVKCITIGYKLKLNFSLTQSVNRDQGSGYALRGTVFTPDGRYLLIGCMGGGGGIAVIDMASQEYLGRILGCKDNVRHLVIRDNWLYLSINKSGCVQRITLQQLDATIRSMKDHVARTSDWQTCNVMKGARTIVISPDGKYLFAACNSSSCVAMVDLDKFMMIGQMPVDSYPVGMDISQDGKMLIVTSQGRNDRGGNCVCIYRLDYNR